MGLKEDLKDGVAESGIYLCYYKDDLEEPSFFMEYLHPSIEGQAVLWVDSKAPGIYQDSEGWIPYWDQFNDRCVVARAPSYTGRIE